MTIKNSPLQLNRCFFSSVRVAANPKAEANAQEKVVLDVNVDIGPLREDKREWYVLLGIRFQPPESTQIQYSGEIEVFGDFVISSEWPEGKCEKLVYINGSGMLYAAAREMICTITARGFYPMYSLPSVSFAKMFSEKVEQKAPQSTEPATAS